MPKALQYQANSVIYFKGNKAETVLLLQAGKVCLNYQDLETQQEIKEVLGKGEFFGVKSALGHYPREETALVLDNSVVLSFTVSEFETLATGNVGLIMQMLKVFSNQMRRIHEQVASLLQEDKPQDPDEGLFSVGEYYFKNKKFAYACHIFKRYLACYPSGSRRAEAESQLHTAEAYIARYSDKTVEFDTVQDKGTDNETNPTNDNSDEGSTSYEIAKNLISDKKYPEAYQHLKKLIEADIPNFSDKAEIDMGQCLIFMDKFDECIKYFTQLLSKKPKHALLANALFFMGQAHAKCGRKDQCVAFLKKAQTLTHDKALMKDIAESLRIIGGT